MEKSPLASTLNYNDPFPAQFSGGPFPIMDDTRFGICHFEMINPTEWFTGLAENINDPLLLKSAVMLRDAGMAWNRFEFAWSTVEPQPGAWDWSALDAYMNLSDYYGLRVLPILAYGVGWACKDPNNYLSPITNLTAWREYINATVTRYKDRPSIGGYWQIWNEANIAPFFAGDFVTDFLPIMVAGTEAVKQADPTAKVVATALTSDDMGGIITQMVNGIGKDKFNALFDAVDIHPYAGDVLGVTRKIQDAKDALAGWYSGELWITEVGWSINPATAGSQADIGKAQDIAKVLVESRVLNVSHTLVHMWCDWGNVINGVKVQNATNPEHWYGLVDINANPKPSYYAYKTVANAIGLAPYQGDPTTAGLNFAPEIEAHVFKRSNSMWVIVLWNPEDRVIPLTLLLPGAGDVMVQNTTGMVTASYTQVRQVDLAVSSDLVIVAVNMPQAPTGTLATDFVIQGQAVGITIVAFGAIPLASVVVVVMYTRLARSRRNREIMESEN